MFPIRIPKVVHLFWDSNTSMSFLRLQTLTSLRKLNPDFEIVLHVSKDKTKAPVWSTHEFREVVYSGEDFYLEAIKLVDTVRVWNFDKFFAEGLPANIKGDLVRLHVLRLEGGFWSDMDIVWIKPLEQIFSGKLHSCSSIEELDFAIVFKNWSTGVFCSAKGNVLLDAIFDVARKETFGTDYQSAGPLVFKKFGFPVDVVKRFSGFKFMDIDYDVFYPVPWDHVEDIFNKNTVLPAYCSAIHWFAGAKEAAIFMNNHSTKEKLSKANNMLTRELRKLELL